MRQALTNRAAMITYGPISFEEMHGKSISLLDAKPVTTEPTPKLIRVTDIYDCLFILALNECKTFFVSLVTQVAVAPNEAR
jgi:hypothetical protein